jgi:3,4-dihydroxy 2-butanone 4-phosphate synthase/3,4-dihydroxy 2-butanone 4-phosphate synthase/GTP cyclohydrolase II
VGGSVGIAGVCLSAEEVEAESFHVALSSETRRRSTLDALAPGAAVNVELPLRAGDPLEGHLVQGHVDAVGKVMRVDDEANGRRVWLRPPPRFLAELAPKGSVGTG